MCLCVCVSVRGRRSRKTEEESTDIIWLFSLMCAKLLQSCLILCEPMDCSPPGSSIHGDSPGKNTGVGCHALFQRIFPLLLLSCEAYSTGLQSARQEPELSYSLSCIERSAEWLACNRY